MSCCWDFRKLAASTLNLFLFHRQHCHLFYEYSLGPSRKNEIISPFLSFAILRFFKVHLIALEAFSSLISRAKKIEMWRGGERRKTLFIDLRDINKDKMLFPPTKVSIINIASS